MAYYVISYVYGDPALQDAHRPAHREYLSTRVQEGTIVVSGPLLKDSVSVGALLIAQVDSFDAAETIVKNDPMKIGGAVESYTIGEWNPPLCALTRQRTGGFIPMEHRNLRQHI